MAPRDRRRPFHRLGVQFVAHLRVGVGAHLVRVGRDQDRMPGRQTAEHLAVLHGEVLRDPVRAAHRIGSDAGARGLVDAGDVLLPLVAGAHGLAQAVVDHRPAAGLRHPRHQPIGEFRIDAAAHLHRAGAKFAQHIGEREQFLVIRPQRGDRHTLRIEMPLLPRAREADRAGLHAVAHDLLHGLDLVVGGGALLAVLAHRVEAHGGVADQRAGIDAEVVVEPVHVLREAFPVRRRRCAAPPSEWLRHRTGIRPSAPRCRGAPGPARASSCRR